MTLRARLLLASGIILGVVLLGAVVLLRTQQSYLLDQVADQLGAARPILRARPPLEGDHGGAFLRRDVPTL